MGSRVPDVLIILDKTTLDREIRIFITEDKAAIEREPVQKIEKSMNLHPDSISIEGINEIERVPIQEIERTMKLAPDAIQILEITDLPED
jgi:hypothetical protein